MNTVTFHRGDVRDVMAAMPDSSVDLLVTSPPFLALRSYLPADHPDKAREIGSEATPAAYLDTMLELSAEWRRLVTPTGSIAVEIGDTYSGAGGYGKPDSTNPAYSPERFAERWEGRTAKRFKRKDDGWPESKSLCGIPTLYAWSLAYGVNLLTGADSPAGRWRIRNLLTWTRPNPPVGALGDKYRPATSFVTVACTSDRRWFDLDAVRTEFKYGDNGGGSGETVETTGEYDGGRRWMPERKMTHAGAPPLDWWDANERTTCPTPTPKETIGPTSTDLLSTSVMPSTTMTTGAQKTTAATSTTPAQPGSKPAASTQTWADDAPDWHPEDASRAEREWQPLHRLPTAPYHGTHYAAYPIALPRRLIESMCPREVCGVCGEGRRRITKTLNAVGHAVQRRSHFASPDGAGDGRIGVPDVNTAPDRADVATLGWSDCGHNSFRPGRVFDPFAGSGTTAVAAAQSGRDAVLIDLDARNVDLCRRRLNETMLIVNEHVDGDTVTWTVRHDMPGTKGEHPDQLNLFTA